MSTPEKTYAQATARRGPIRQVGVFLAVTYLLAIAIAIVLRTKELAALLTILVPVIAVAITVPVTLPRGQRGRAWRDVGFGLPRVRDLLLALLGPLVVTTCSFGIAAVFGVIRFPGLGSGLRDEILKIVLVTVVFTFVMLGEEIGWRGYLLLRLREITSGRSAALLTGACHALFHVPLLTITTSYQSDGDRWIVVPMVLATVTLAGVWYGWLRFRSGSIWPVNLSHSAFNSFMETTASLAVASSAATTAYVTTETGVATLLVTASLAGYLLLRRGTDFDK